MLHVLLLFLEKDLHNLVHEQRRKFFLHLLSQVSPRADHDFVVFCHSRNHLFCFKSLQLAVYLFFCCGIGPNNPIIIVFLNLILLHLQVVINYSRGKVNLVFFVVIFQSNLAYCFYSIITHQTSIQLTSSFEQRPLRLQFYQIQIVW